MMSPFRARASVCLMMLMWLILNEFSARAVGAAAGHHRVKQLRDDLRVGVQVINDSESLPQQINRVREPGGGRGAEVWAEEGGSAPSVRRR